jgi:small ligand-binding sensory domain FIST
MNGTPEPMSSDNGEKYAALAARIRVGKASQEDAVKAILELIADNERLAVLLGKRKAKAAVADALLAALQGLVSVLPGTWDCDAAGGNEEWERARAAIARATQP